MPVRLFLCMSLIRWYKHTHAHMHTCTVRVVCQASFCSVLLSFSLHVFLFLFLIFHSLCSSLCSPCFFLYLSPSLYWEACESSLSDILDVESGTEKGLPSQCWMSLHHRVLMLQTSLRGPNLKNTNAFRILAFSICSRCCNNFFTQSSFPLHTPSWLYYKLNQEIKQFSIHQVCKSADELQCEKADKTETLLSFSLLNNVTFSPQLPRCWRKEATAQSRWR